MGGGDTSEKVFEKGNPAPSEWFWYNMEDCRETGLVPMATEDAKIKKANTSLSCLHKIFNTYKAGCQG